MRIVWFVVEVVVTALSAWVAAVAATWLWNLGVHGTPVVDWMTCARLAMVLGVGLPVTRRVAKPRGAARECRVGIEER